MAMAHQQQHQQQLKQAQQQQVFNSQAQSQQQQQASLMRQQHPQQPAPQQQPQQQQQSQQQQTRAEAHSPQGPSQAALQLWQLWGNQDRTPQAGEVQVNTFRRSCRCLCECIVVSFLLCQSCRM